MKFSASLKLAASLLAPLAFLVACPVESESSVQLEPDWALDRIDERTLPLDNRYSHTRYNTKVNIYILDSGIKYSHVEFEGRARLGADFIGGSEDVGGDCEGHGTSVASAAAGKTTGVSKTANLISVRIIGCSDGATLNDAIRAIDWITANAIRPAVVNISIDFRENAFLWRAIQRSIDSGITYVMAAGNSPRNDCSYAPSRPKHIILVASSDETDGFTPWSALGPCVDIIAPGVWVKSAYYVTNVSYSYVAGTSISAGLVSGAAAQYLAANPNATPAEVHDFLISSSTKDVIRNIFFGTPNRLLYVEPKVRRQGGNN